MRTDQKVKRTTQGRVYVADDDYLTKETLVNLIMDAGWNVVGSSCDSEQAIKEIPGQNVDVAVLDLRFPGSLDGMDIARAIQKQCDAEIIFVSAFGDPQTRELAQSLRPVGYVDKPFDSLNELGPLIRAAVARREFVRTNEERLQLIDRRGKQGLSAEEAGRLEQLQQSTTAYLDRYHPPNTAVVDSILERMRKILK